MKPSDAYGIDFVLSWLLRWGIIFGVLAISAMALGACSYPSLPANPFSNGLSVRPPLAVDQEPSTRNRLPHGGCDEKSDSTPKLSAERLWQTST